MIKTYPTKTILKVENYPYGRLRTEAYFGLEFHPSKGYRTTFQTLNPKTGRLNAVKKSTYSRLLLMVRDESSGFVSYTHHSLENLKGLNNTAEAFTNPTPSGQMLWDLLTIPERAYCYRQAVLGLVVSAQAMCIYAGADQEAVKTFIAPALLTLKSPEAAAGENVWDKIRFDLEAWEALKVPDFKPFRVTSVSLIDGNGMRELSKEEAAEVGVTME